MCSPNPFPELYAIVMMFTWVIAAELLYFGDSRRPGLQ